MARRVKLFEQRGETSIFIDAEIDDQGTVIVSGYDIGEAPKKFFGDSDYEYWVHVPASEKPALLTALRGEAERRGVAPAAPGLGSRLRQAVARATPWPAPPSPEFAEKDAEILALIEALFAGSDRAYSAYRDFIDAAGIESKGGSWS